METILSTGRPQDDPNNYLNADTKQIAYSYETVTTLIDNLWTSINKFLFCDAKSDLPRYMQSASFFNKPQKYRSVPTKKVPLKMLDQLKKIRQGFDPIAMTISRCQKQQNQQQSHILQPKQSKIIKASLDQQVLPLKKTIKRYYIQDEEDDSKQSHQTQEIRERRIECVLDELVKDYQQKKIELQQKSFQGFFKLKDKQIAKEPQTPISKLNEQAKPQSTQKNEGQPSTGQQKPNLNALSQQKIYKIDQNNNPFKNITPSKPISLFQLIQSRNPNGFTNHQNDSPTPSQSSKSDVSSTFTFNPHSNHRNNQIPFVPNSPSQTCNSAKTISSVEYDNSFNNGQFRVSDDGTQISNMPNNFTQFASPAPKQSTPFEDPKNENIFLKGVSGMNGNGNIKDFFKPNSPNNRLFDTTPSQKTQKKTAQSYRKRRGETSVRIQ